MKTRILLAGGSVLEASGETRPADVLIEGRTVRRIGRRLPARGCRVLPAKGLRVLPGLIDTQLNGAFGCSFGSASPEEIAAVCRLLPAFGVTGFLATIISLSRARILSSIRNIVEAARFRGGARILGIHLEGPYLAPERKGAHDPKCLRNPSLKEFREFHKAARGMLRMMTLAPERPGAGRVIREGARKGVIMSAGHSIASAERVREAVEKEGLRHATHCFNAMAPLHHRQGSILNAVLADDRISTGMIYDRLHLSADAATLLLRSKPEGKLVMVSDAVAALGLAEGPFLMDGRFFTIKDGAVRVRGKETLAGSAFSLLDGVRMLAQDTGIPEGRAWRLGSEAPAKLLGQRRKGVLREGADADVVLVGRDGRVRATFVEGDLTHADRHHLGL